MKKANLFIIGAQKAGTTTLYEYLRQHPDIQFSDLKETRYFSHEQFYNKGEKYFESFFSNYEKQKIIASADVQLLPSVKGPERLSKYNENAKLVVVLRDPVKRAYSAFNFAKQKRMEKEKSNFKEAFYYYLKTDKNKSRKESDRFNYFYDGLYWKHLSHWSKFFDRDHFLIITLSDIKENPQKTLDVLFSFLGLNRIPVSPDLESNKTGGYRLKVLHRVFFGPKSLLSNFSFLFNQKMKNRIRKNIILKLRDLLYIEKKTEPLPKDDYDEIFKFYEDDLVKLKQDFKIEI